MDRFFHPDRFLFQFIWFLEEVWDINIIQKVQTSILRPLSHQDMVNMGTNRQLADQDVFGLETRQRSLPRSGPEEKCPLCQAKR